VNSNKTVVQQNSLKAVINVIIIIIIIGRRRHHHPLSLERYGLNCSINRQLSVTA